MSKGPCLCGDPYCPSCGDPSLAVHEEAAEQLFEALKDAPIWYVHFLTAVTPVFLEAMEKAISDEVSERRFEDGQYIDHLEHKLHLIQEQGTIPRRSR